MTMQQIEGLLLTMNTHLELAKRASEKIAEALKEEKRISKKPISGPKQKALMMAAKRMAKYTPV